MALILFDSLIIIVFLLTRSKCIIEIFVLVTIFLTNISQFLTFFYIDLKCKE